MKTILPLDIEELIKRLKCKKMIIKNDDKAFEIISKMEYVNFKWYRSFLYDEKYKVYKDDVKIEYLYYLYNFDLEIKSLLAKYILIIENKIRFNLIQVFLESFEHKTPLSRSELNNASNENYEKFKKKIKKAMQYSKKGKYKPSQYDTPSWILYSNMNINMLSEYYSYLNNKSKRLFCKKMKIDYLDINSIFTMLVEVRNLCAHNSPLYNNIESNLSNNMTKKLMTNHILTTEDDMKGLFSVLICFKFVLKNETFREIYKKVKKELKHLIRKIGFNYKNEIMNALNFPKNFHLILKRNWKEL